MQISLPAHLLAAVSQWTAETSWTPVSKHWLHVIMCLCTKITNGLPGYGVRMMLKRPLPCKPGTFLEINAASSCTHPHDVVVFTVALLERPSWASSNTEQTANTSLPPWKWDFEVTLSTVRLSFVLFLTLPLHWPQPWILVRFSLPVSLSLLYFSLAVKMNLARGLSDFQVCEKVLRSVVLNPGALPVQRADKTKVFQVTGSWTLPFLSVIISRSIPVCTSPFCPSSHYKLEVPLFFASLCVVHASAPLLGLITSQILPEHTPIHLQKYWSKDTAVVQQQACTHIQKYMQIHEPGEQCVSRTCPEAEVRLICCFNSLSRNQLLSGKWSWLIAILCCLYYS